MAVVCEGCGKALTNTRKRYVLNPESQLRDLRSEASFGVIHPENLIRDILSRQAKVCQPCARAAIDVFTGPNIEVDELDEDEEPVEISRLCRCGHYEQEHSNRACFVDQNGKRCSCRVMRLVVATHDDDEDGEEDDYIGEDEEDDEDEY